MDATPPLPPQPAILFVTATRIGDAVLSTGLLDHLVTRYPSARITVAAGAVAAPLFKGVPGLERLIAMTKRKRAGHWLDLYRNVAPHRWDLVVDLRGSALSWLLWTRRRAMMAKGDADEHRVRQLARLFRLNPPPAPRIWLTDEARAQAAARLPDTPFLAVGPTANWGGKQWPAERFAGLLRRLTAPAGPFPDFKIAVLGAPHERAQAEPLLTGLAAGQVLDLIGEGDLLTAAAVAERARLYIGNDSGLMHIAAAVKTPTIGLFGPSRDQEYAPWGPHCLVLRTPESHHELTTSPSFDYRSAATLMGGLSVEAAFDGIAGFARRLELAA